MSTRADQIAAAVIARRALRAVAKGLTLWRFPVETIIDINPSRGSVRITCRGGKSFADTIAGEIEPNPPVNHRYDGDGRAVSEFEVLIGPVGEAKR